MHNGNFVWKDRLTCFSVRRDPVLTCQTAHWKSYWLLWFVPSIKSDLSCKDADLWKIHPFKIPERKPEENDVKQHNPHWKHQSIRGPLKAARAWFSVYVGITNILANSFSVTHQADFISVHLEKKMSLPICWMRFCFWFTPNPGGNIWCFSGCTLRSPLFDAGQAAFSVGRKNQNSELINRGLMLCN